LIEIIASALFTLIFLTQEEKSTRFSEDPALVSLFISIAYSSCIALTTPISGGCINPAVGLGLNLINYFDKTTGASIEHIWIYVVMPPIGSLLAVLFYETKFK
jgi:aquaporin TIP/aquaporin related protein